MRDRMKNVKLSVPGEIFSSKLADPKIINAPSRPMINWLPIRKPRFIGAIRRFLRKACVWKKRRIALERWKHSIKLWKTKLALIDIQSCFGITKPDSMPPGFWKKNRNGSPLLQFIKNLQVRGEAAVKKPKRVLPDCVWSIFFG